MTGIVVMTLVAVALTLLAVVGMVLLRDRTRPLFVIGMLCLAASWFIPVILSLLMWQSGLEVLPWPANAIINVVLYTVGGGLLAMAALTRGVAERTR